MRTNRTFYFRILAGGALGVLCLSGTVPARAVEPVNQFADALCQHRLYNLAIKYLDGLESSGLVAAEVKPTLDYEAGVVLIRAAAETHDSGPKEKQLEEARARLQKFLEANPRHELAPPASMRLADILLERGRGRLAQARKSKEPSAGLADATKLIRNAQKAFEAAEKEFSAQLGRLPKPAAIAPSQAHILKARERLKSNLAQAELMDAWAYYELSKTAEPGSAEANKHLTTAADKYSLLAEKYRQQSAGFYARLFQGDCYRELNETKKALGCYQSLMDAESGEKGNQFADQLMVLKAKGFRQALATWVDPREAKYIAAIERGEQWFRDYAGDREGTPDALAIRYLTALAYQQAARGLPEKDPNQSRYRASARKHAARVEKVPGEFQRPARVMLAGLREEKGAAAKTTPKNFAEAFQAGKDALGSLEEAKLLENIARAKNDAETAKASEAKVKQEAVRARKLFEFASDVLDDTATPEQRTELRYYLCYLAWQGGNLLDAAIIGHWLAEHYPQHNLGREGAKVAFAAAVNLYNQSKQPNKDFESALILRVAENIANHWADQPEGQEAVVMLLRFAIQQRDYAKAVAYLEKIPPSSPQRADAEVKAGQALWAAYLRGQQAQGAQRPPQAEIDQLRTQSQKILTAGVDRARSSGTTSPALASAVLYLAQMQLENRQPAKALELLQDQKLGPLTLVKNKSPAASGPGFAEETYKVALRAYVANKQLGEAEKTMKLLEGLIGKSNDPKASEKLTFIYVSLGRSLEAQLKELRKAGQQKDLEEVSRSFENFLRQIAKRKDLTFNSLNWVAQTYYSLGSGVDDGSGKLSSQAKQYYEEAVKGYERILELTSNNASFAPQQGESLLGVNLRLAAALGRLGRHDDAINIVTTVLRDKPTMLTAQVLGADTYQAQGKSKKVGYVKAIQGGEPAGKDRKNVIWGWGKIAKMTSGKPQFASTFHEARRKMAECRYLYGMTQPDEAQRKRYLDSAKQDLWYTYKLVPDLGGAETSAEYEALLKKLQAGLGAEPNGLDEFKAREAATKAAQIAK